MPSESVDCRSIAARMQFECPDQDARMHLECRRNLFRSSWYLIIHFECRRNLRLPLECGSNAVRISNQDARMHLDGCRNRFWYFQYFKNPTGMHLECGRNLKIAAQMQLKYIWNVWTRKIEWPQWISNASRLLSESILIFWVLKESSRNALRMPSESLDCCSNAARMLLECSSNDPTRTPECISNAVWMPRMRLKCSSNAARMRLECSSNVPTRMQECISNAAEIYFDLLGT